MLPSDRLNLAVLFYNPGGRMIEFFKRSI